MEMSSVLRDIEIAIFCGGRGTRLASIIGDDIPKCLAPIRGRPFIECLFDRLKDQGARKITLLAGHLAETVSEWLKTRPKDQLFIRFAMDPFPNCGEMTALRHAHEVGALGSCEIMAMNGDTLVNGDFEWLISYFHEWPISLCVNGVPTGVKIIFPAPLHRKYLPIMVDGSGYFTFLDIGTPEGYVMAKELLS